MTYRAEDNTVPPLANAPASGGVAAEPVAWVIPGDDNANLDGSIDARAFREGEFTRPLYEHPPVAAEPVNWMDDPSADARWNAGLDYALVQLCRKLDVETHAVCWDAATETVDGDVRSVIGNILTIWAGDDWMDAPARLAAAPTPPAGGGETVVGADYSDALELASKSLTSKPSPVPSAGDLISLSAAIVGAMESYLRVCSSGGMPQDKRDTVEKAVKQAAKLGYFDALAAPAAPRKGPSEEETRRRVAIILNDTFDAAPDRIGIAADAVLALLTPADRGDHGGRAMSAVLTKISFAVKDRHVERKDAALLAAHDEIMRLQLLLDPDKLGVPDGYRLVKNEPGEMIQVDDLIAWMTKFREQFGNSCVYARDVCWGAVALNRRDDDAETQAAKALRPDQGGEAW